jgi:hypothetical protein
MRGRPVVLWLLPNFFEHGHAFTPQETMDALRVWIHQKQQAEVLPDPVFLTADAWFGFFEAAATM